MSDLIDRGDLLDALDELEEEWEDAGLNPSYYDAKRVIKNAKVVTKEKCTWIRCGINEYMPRCSDSVSYEMSISNGGYFNYCPYCGGKIKYYFNFEMKVVSK